MAPLERVSYSPVASETFASSTFQHPDSCFNHQHHWQHSDYFILSQRDVVVRTNPLSEFEVAPPPSLSQPAADRTNRSTPNNPLAALVDLFTDNLCLCPPHGPRGRHPGRQIHHPHSSSSSSSRRGMAVQHGYHDDSAAAPISSAATMRKNIVYPVARYPARLNSPELVQQRRKSLQEYSTFRPLAVGE